MFLEMNRDHARASARAQNSSANFEARFGRVVWRPRADARQHRRLHFAARIGQGVQRQVKTLRGKEHQSGVAVMMRERILRPVIVIGAYIVGAATIFYVAGKGIGKMRMVVRVFEAIHNSNEGLRRHDNSERHAEDSDRPSKGANRLEGQLYSPPSANN